MKNFVQEGDLLTLTAPYAVLSGEGALVGNVFGVAAVDLASGVAGTFATAGVFDLAKVTAQAWNQGDRIFWDNSAKLSTTSSAGNTLIGVAIEAAANPSTTGRVRLVALAVNGESDRVKVSASKTAGGTINAGRLVERDASGALIEATANSQRVVGRLAGEAQVLSGAAMRLEVGFVPLTAAAPIKAGRSLKAAAGGRVCQHVDSLTAAETIAAPAAGGNFANQPANDAIEVVSANAADVGQIVTLIGTTHGGTVVVTQDVVLNGTTAVASVKTDWGVLLAAKLSAVCAGIVTIREASGDAAITTIAAGQTSAGVTAVTAANQGAHNVIPQAVAAGASTKTVGIRYTQNDGATVAYQAVALDGTTAVSFGTAALLVDEVYVGDVATATVATFRVGVEEDENRKIGRALDAAVVGAAFDAVLTL